jgi:hypothetical protein
MFLNVHAKKSIELRNPFDAFLFRGIVGEKKNCCSKFVAVS